MDIGYIRVSSYDQSTLRQLEGVRLDKVFEEKASAKDLHRPVLQECLRFVREGDVLHVHSIDRLARNLKDLVEIVSELTQKKVVLRFHKENLVFGESESPFNTLQLHILGAVSQFERALIRERQREGIAKALKMRRHLGRKCKLDEEKERQVMQMVHDRYPKTQIAKTFGISRTLVYRIIRKYRKKDGTQDG